VSVVYPVCWCTCFSLLDNYHV